MRWRNRRRVGRTRRLGTGGTGETARGEVATETDGKGETSAGTQINAGIDASKVVITKLHMDKDRKALLARKGGNGNSEEAMQTVE